MSNKDAMEMKDTRGRPRNPKMESLTAQIEKAYLEDALPIQIPCQRPKIIAKGLRQSTSFIEMQEEIGVKFRLMVDGRKLVVGLSRG
jgi:hypothetical protein